MTLLLVFLEELVTKAVFVRVVACLMKVVHVELPDKGGEVVVLEVLWQNLLRELIRLLD